MSQLWEVVGGADKGGIVVRAGQETTSKQEGERLSTGALVEEIELAGERLHYRKVRGGGPSVGWVSVRIPAKDLVIKTDKPHPGILKPWVLDPHPALERCKMELAKDTPSWTMVDMDHFNDNYMKNEPGMRYGMKFPHSLEQLTSEEFGAQWMTKAFHASTVLPKTNKVVRIVSTKPLSGGGAAEKALVVVEYEESSPDLHTHLFMKYPYAYVGSRKSDRMNSSVMQLQDCPEVDALRTLEGVLPFRVTKYYFADISNVSTNFINITEFVTFGNPQKPLKDFKPFEVEPPYEKFLDDEQWGDRAIDYYREMTRAVATMAGWYKAGKLGDPDSLARFFYKSGPQGGGLPEIEFVRKLKMAVEFIEVSAHHFPPDVVTPEAMAEWKRVLNVTNTYTAEFSQWMHSNEDYMVCVHGNMNADNTFWSRDEEGKLQVGVIDWGGLSVGPVPHRLWWCNYAVEFHFFDKYLDEILELFIKTYEEAGGPKIDFETVKIQFLFAAAHQNIGLLGAVPQIYRVIRKGDWASCKDRQDPRIKGNFLTRMYVQGFVLIMTMIKRWDIGKTLDETLERFKVPKKSMPVV